MGRPYETLGASRSVSHELADLWEVGGRKGLWLVAGGRCSRLCYCQVQAGLEGSHTMGSPRPTMGTGQVDEAVPMECSMWKDCVS